MSFSRESPRGSAAGEGGRRFRLRPDLKVITDPGEDGNGATVRIADPSTGKQYSFSEDEYFLCQVANGTNSVQSIQDMYRGRYGREIALRELVTFYRRLRILGLLERVDGQDAAEPAAGPGFAGPARRMGLDGRNPPSPAGPSTRPRKPMTIWLFNPSWLLVVLYVVFFPLKYLHWLVWPGMLFAGMIVFARWDALAVDITRMAASYTQIAGLVASLFTVNLAVRLSQGTVIRAFGGEVRRFGLTLALGFIPRFAIDRSGIENLDRRGKLWAHGAPLLARLGLFVLGTLFWATQRHTGTWFPEAALIVGQLGFLSFALTALPLVPSHGYHWIATYLDQPRLRQKAFAALKAKLGGRPAPEHLSGADGVALALFALAVVLACGTLALGALLYVGIALEARFSGAGVFMFLCLFAAFLLWALSLRATVKHARAARAEARRAGARGARGGAVSAGLPVPSNIATMRSVDYIQSRGWQMGPVTDADYAQVRTGWRPRLFALLFWGGLAATVAVVGFMPYDYEVGGEFRILPATQVEVHARTEGEVVEILVQEGDWVEKGQTMAVLSNWDQVRNVAVTKAELEKAAATLRRLEEGATPEEIDVAVKEVERMESRVTFSEADAERARILLKSETISRRSAEEAQSEYQKDLADLEVARANLRLVKSDATKADLEAARAEVRRLTAELAFREDELDRTRIVAPAEGRVITPNLDLSLGKYLPVGGLLAELEDNRTAQAEIEVPETDIGEVQIGDTARLKVWGFSDQELIGTVVAVAPSAEKREYGQIVRVRTELTNSDGLLRSQMTGYGKVAGPTVPVWKAFLQLFIRFFRVEVWSWIP